MSLNVLAIDPGNVESGYALIDLHTRRPIVVGKLSNDELRRELLEVGTYGALFESYHMGAIEMVESYGMSVGADVFDTCVWIGRFVEATGGWLKPIKRGEVKMHHCQSRAAKDSNIIQALVDRFAYGQPNKGKGTKANPGWFYGFAKDGWQAYALGVTVADRYEAAA